MANLFFNYSGEWEDVAQVLRRFPANEILKRIGKEAILLQETRNGGEIHGARWVKYKVLNTRTRTTSEKESIITIWGLIDLAYYTVIASHDYRGNKEIDDSQFYALVDAVESMKQKREVELLEKMPTGTHEFFMYLWGFAGEQFKAETQYEMLDNAGRELYILFEIAKKASNTIDIAGIIEEETGFNWQKIICTLFLAWVCSTKQSLLDIGSFEFANPDILTREEYKDILKRYTFNYDEIRKSSKKRQVFYTKPYIITQKNELLGISPFLNLCLFEHGLMWIIRDHFRKENSQKFTDFFGKCFELYFQELLDYSLEENEYERIPEGKTPRADWKLKIDGFQFLIEQKSSLLRLDAKQQEPNLDSVKEFANKIIRAIKQLANTERSYNEGPYFKIILLYDDYLMPEILDKIFEMDECDVNADNRYWIVTIAEMERLLSLCKAQRDTFDAIIREKNNREQTNSKQGKNLTTILGSFGISKNLFAEQSSHVYYQDFAKNQSLRLLM